MKLKQIVHLVETAEESPEQWLIANNREIADITVKANGDGSIDIVGNLELGSKEYPTNFPPIKNVHGSYGALVESAEYSLPETVSGGCNIWVAGTTHIKTSRIPKCTGKGKLYLSDNQGKASMEIDDVSAIKTYSEVTLMVGITSGLQHVAEVNGLTCLKIKDNLDGIPATLNLSTLMITVKDGSALKGMHKKLKTMSADYFQINTGTAGPLMAILKPSYKFARLVLNVEHSLYKSKEISEFMFKLKGRDLEIFDAQEAMIDAGYKEYAGM